MKFLIAGYGSIGRRHMRNLIELGQTDLLLYRSHKSTLTEDEIGAIPVETNLEAALGRRPDAVIVSNPTSLHLDVAIPAANSGCHLLMEKPVSHSMERIDSLREAVVLGGGNVLTGFQYRFHPGLQRVKELLVEGAIGRPLSYRAEWGEYLPGWHPWEDYRKAYSARADLGGGVVLTLCHPLDYLRWLAGEVEELYASTGHISDLEIDVEDSSDIVLKFDNGASGSVHLDYYRRPGVHRLEISGSKGLLSWNNADGGVHLYRADSPDGEVFPAPQGFERNRLFLDEMKHFIEIIQGKAVPICTLEDGIRALQLVLAVYRSSNEKRALSAGEIYLSS